MIVDGVNTATKHAKPRRANDRAGIIDRDMPIHASNVMLVHKGKRVRVGYELRDGKKVRVAKDRQGQDRGHLMSENENTRARRRSSGPCPA